MAEATAEILRALELHLFRCSLSPKSNTTHLHATTEPEEKALLVLAEDIVSSIEKGNYVEALSSDVVRMIFKFADSWDFQDSIDCADRFYCEAEKSVECFFRNGLEPHFSPSEAENDMNRSCRAFLLLCIGVAAFLVFTQSSVTGPSEHFPSFPFPFWPIKDDYKAIASGGEWDMWACNQLIASGCALLGKLAAVQVFDTIQWVM